LHLNFQQNDDEFAKEDFVEAQESAGMEEPEQRLAIGGHFNHVFMWATLKSQGETSSPEPTGAVSLTYQLTISS
jgi:superoxide dismutase